MASSNSSTSISGESNTGSINSLEASSGLILQISGIVFDQGRYWSIFVGSPVPIASDLTHLSVCKSQEDFSPWKKVLTISGVKNLLDFCTMSVKSVP